MKQPQQPPARPPRVFALQRIEDVHGMSGTGLVAWGVQLPSGRIVMEWQTRGRQVAQWDHIGDAIHYHGHGGKTRIVWLDTSPVAQRIETTRLWATYEAYAEALAKATPGSVAHLSLAMQCADGLPELLKAHDGLADAHAAALAEVESLRAERDAMQAHLDAMADMTPQAGQTAA